jgi:hypothetical protein
VPKNGGKTDIFFNFFSTSVIPAAHAIDANNSITQLLQNRYKTFILQPIASKLQVCRYKN